MLERYIVYARLKADLANLKASYKDKASIGAHGSSKEFQGFQKTMKDEDLIAAPMQLKFIKNAGGFSSRL